MRKPPPRKKGDGLGPRSLNGAIVDVAAVAQLLGATEHTVRARAARGLLPCRRWGGRLIFVRSEILAFLTKLEGTSVEQALANVVARNGGDA